MTTTEAPIHGVIEKWHDLLRGRLAGGLDELLDDDVVFWSPIVFSPQEGKDLTKMYLNAAGATFTGDAPDGSGVSGAVTDDERAEDGSFGYVRETLDGHTAVLEFVTRVDGVEVNGVDIITCNDEGRIVEFKVMLRPLKAINKMHEQMRAMLDQMQG